MENSESQPIEPTPPAETEPPVQAEVDSAPVIAEELPEKKRSVVKIILIILGVLILLFLLIVGAAFYYLQSQGLTPDKLSPQPKAPATTIAPRNLTTNTYQNRNYNFSMPVEKELKIKEAPYGFGVTSIEMTSSETPADEGPDFQMLLFPKALGVTIGQDFNKYYDSPNNTSQVIKDPSGASQNFTKVRNRTVNNLRAFEFISQESPPDPEVEPEIGAYIEMGTDVLVVTTGESNRNELEAMLKDFHYPLK